jgi:hypothetical protein
MHGGCDKWKIHIDIAVSFLTVTFYFLSQHKYYLQSQSVKLPDTEVLCKQKSYQISSYHGGKCEYYSLLRYCAM